MRDGAARTSLRPATPRWRWPRRCDVVLERDSILPRFPLPEGETEESYFRTPRAGGPGQALWRARCRKRRRSAPTTRWASSSSRASRRTSSSCRSTSSGRAARASAWGRAAARPQAPSWPTPWTSPRSTRCPTACCSSASSRPSAWRCPISTSTSSRAAAKRSSTTSRTCTARTTCPRSSRSAPCRPRTPCATPRACWTTRTTRATASASSSATSWASPSTRRSPRTPTSRRRTRPRRTSRPSSTPRSSIEGHVRGEGVHACATIICRDPMADHVPMKRDTKGGGIITQYDGHYTPELGLLKMDFLGLRTLDVLSIACRNVEQRFGTKVVPEEIPIDDEAAFELMQSGNMDGLFQVEGALYVSLFARLPPTRFSDIVASIALNRPGPLESGMVDDYVKVASGKTADTLLRRPSPPHLGGDVRHHGLPRADHADLHGHERLLRRQGRQAAQGHGQEEARRHARPAGGLEHGRRGERLSRWPSPSRSGRMPRSSRSTRSTNRTPPPTPSWSCARRT